MIHSVYSTGLNLHEIFELGVVSLFLQLSIVVAAPNTIANQHKTPAPEPDYYNLKQLHTLDLLLYRFIGIFLQLKI